MKGHKPFFVLALCLSLSHARSAAQEAPLDAGKRAYEMGDYSKAIEILRGAAGKEPGNAEIQLLLLKSYLESNQYDNAVSSGERAVALDPKSSVYHQWLGEADGGKAGHTSMLSAYSWARKTQKEFAAAVELDERNFDAAQDLIEFDCSAPSMVGGGEDKAQPLVKKLSSLDAAEGHFGAGVCRAVKKDYSAADGEYAKALESKPKTADRIFDIGDYFLQRGEGEKLLEVAAAGETLAPKDPRGKYYRAAGFILKGEKYADAEKLLREYLEAMPMRSTNPRPWEAHYWLGRLYAAQKDGARAKGEYQEALKLNPKYKKAEEALKQSGGQ
jgi:tetratricopeptide (TPR) repeat protein